jgi:hypothetical protein
MEGFGLSRVGFFFKQWAGPVAQGGGADCSRARNGTNFRYRRRTRRVTMTFRRWVHDPELLNFDEIGIWSELKLEIIQEYGSAYTKAFNNPPGLKKYYIDGFSGAGRHVSKRDRAVVEGSPARALNVSPPFDGYYFIDLDPEKTDYLLSVSNYNSSSNGDVK